MAESIRLRVNDVVIAVPEGTSVAAAVVMAGSAAFRRSVSGEGRGPLCGMGICFECRAEVDGAAYRRTCQMLAREGMEVRTER
jgi:D-hydroxyproline dehydrogenase subunit gamma